LSSVGIDPLASQPKKRRRRRIRIVSIIGYVLVVFGLSWFFEQRLPTTVIFVRHAETDAAMGEGGDPPLNAAGRARAEALAKFLADTDVDAGVDAIYASPRLRTQQTAEPLAKRLGLEVIVEDQQDIGLFIRHVLREHRGDIVLVVSHSNLIGPLIDELHGYQDMPAIAAADFDNLYIVTVPRWGKVKTLRFHYEVGPQELGSSDHSATSFTSP
jgi:2,3-bisphosphoglycerate-dependent phosphoglycerate mutase